MVTLILHRWLQEHKRHNQLGQGGGLTQDQVSARKSTTFVMVFYPQVWQEEATWKAAQKRKREEVPSEHLYKVDDKLHSKKDNFHSKEDKLLPVKEKFYAWDIALTSRKRRFWGANSVTHCPVLKPSRNKQEAHSKPKRQKRITVEPTLSSPKTGSGGLHSEETITLYPALSPLVMDVADVEKEKLNKRKAKMSTKMQGKADTMTGKGDEVVMEVQGRQSRQQVYNEEEEEEKQKKKAREKEKKEEEERKKAEVKMRLLQLVAEEDMSSKKSGLSSHRLPSSVSIIDGIR